METNRPPNTVMDHHKFKDRNVNLDELSKEALIERIHRLEAHVNQLQNIIAKGNRTHITDNSKKKTKRPFVFSNYNTRHVALRLVYLGWDYQGYATQEDTNRTIEAALFDALLKTKLIESRETSNYHRCGRTDKGVSAFSQVVSLDLRTNLLDGYGVKIREGGTAPDRPGDKTTEIGFVHILNKVLPAEIRVLAWSPVDPEFSARFSCRKRTYKYFFPKGILDLDAMRSAAQKLIGCHDFRNLCKMDVSNGVVNYLRRIVETDIKTIDDGGGSGFEMCELTVVGLAFLWHQIRCIVAVLFLVGQGREKPEIIDELLNIEAHPRKPQYAMAAELPLVLFDCQYENVNWIYEPERHEENIRHLQEMWTGHAIKSSMIKRMLDELNATHVTAVEGDQTDRVLWCEGHNPVMTQTDSLVRSKDRRVYRPLMQRDKCETLEGRIAHYSKKRRLLQDKDSSDDRDEETVNSDKEDSANTDSAS